MHISWRWGRSRFLNPCTVGSHCGCDEVLQVLVAGRPGEVGQAPDLAVGAPGPVGTSQIMIEVSTIRGSSADLAAPAGG
jgi:hypothetical protein